MPVEQALQLCDHMGRTIERSVPSDLDRQFIRWNYNGASNITTRDIEEQPYKYHSLIFAACNYILRNVSRLSWYMYDVREPENYITTHDVLDILQRPHPLLTKTAFLQAIILSILLPSGGIGKASKGGQCFIRCHDLNDDPIDISKGTIPELMYPTNDDYMFPVFDDLLSSSRKVIGWKYKTGADKPIPYGLRELIRISQFNPYNWLEGVSNFHPAMISLMLDLKSDLHNDALFENFGVPTGVLSTEQQLGGDQRREELRHWNETMHGVANAYKVALLSKGLNYQHIGLSNVDMQFAEMKDFVKEEILAPYGVNKIGVGDYEQINFATIKEGRKMLWHDVNLPMIDMICEALNFAWIQYIDPNLRVGLDISKVEYLQPNWKPNAEVAGMLVEKCFLPPAMALRKAGIPLTEEELIEAPWLSLNPLEMKAQFTPSFPVLPGEPPSSGDGDDKDDDKDVPTKTIIIKADEKERWWYGYVEKILDPNEKKYIRTLRSYFDSQRNLFNDNVDEWWKRQGKQVKMVIISIDDLLIDKKTQDKEIINLSKPIIKNQLELTEDQLKNELGQLVTWKVTDDEVAKSVNRRAKYLKGLNNTTFKSVESKALALFDQANTENWTPAELSKELKKAFNGIYEGRKNQTMTIARTEIGSVTEDARYVAFVMEDIQYHEWLSAVDEKTRDTHLKENTHVVRVGDRFPVTGLLHPLDNSTGDAGEVINCRCVNIAAEK